MAILFQLLYKMLEHLVILLFNKGLKYLASKYVKTNRKTAPTLPKRNKGGNSKVK